MADDIENDDQWLYGDNAEGIQHEDQSEPLENSSPTSEQEIARNEDEEEEEKISDDKEIPANDEPSEETNENQQDDENETENQNGDGSEKEDYDEEDSDDDVNVVIGDIDIKASSSYTSLNIKRGGLLTSTNKTDKSQQPQQSGKFSIEEFDQAGLINGIPVGDFNLDSLEDKPWRKPGADITDYFNYGFNEDTWRAYCERQKRMRVNESGTGLLPLNAIGMPRGPVPIMNDNSKYSGSYTGVRKAGPPPGRRMTGSIDVIGGAPTRIGTPIGKTEPPKENVIQVMTADRREYSRKPGFPDMSVPPPSTNFEEFHPEYDFNPEPEPFYGGYEPTQDCQWGTGTPAWQPQEIKTLTGNLPPVIRPVPPPVPMPQLNMPPPGDPSVMPAPSSSLKDTSPPHRSISKDKERESSIRRDRSRERDHRHDRSRSRSHRHKSRSRSPSHRSHRKKKSRRHDDSE